MNSQSKHNFSEIELKAMKIADLKALLQSYKLKTTGNKTALVARLLDYFSKYQTPKSNTMSVVIKDRIKELEREVTRLELELELSQLEDEIKRSQQQLESSFKLVPSSTPLPSVLPNKTLTLQSNPSVPETLDNNMVVSHSCFVNKNDMIDIMKHLPSFPQDRLPTPEPPVFEGDPLKYPKWNQAFKLRIESKSYLSGSDKLFYLQKYLKGEALETIEGFLEGGSDASYEEARRILDERYGDPFIISEAYRKKLDEWPKIGKNDSKALRRFSDFLVKCRAAMRDVPNLRVLDDNHQNRSMLRLFPDHIIVKWNSKVNQYQREKRKFPPFTVFVSFIENEAQEACHPSTSLEAVRKMDKDSRGSSRHLHSHVTSASQESCPVCKAAHKVFQCLTFKDLSIADRQDTVKKLQLCPICLNQGHGARKCPTKITCKYCHNKHNTLLHRPRNNNNQVASTSENPATTSDTSNCGCIKRDNNTTTQLSTMIVPVYVSSKSHPSKEYLTYAMLDTQSDSTFITNEVYTSIQCDAVPVNLKVSTMTCREKVIKCNKLLDITVRGYYSNTKVAISSCYTREFIPHNSDHLPSPKVAQSYPHLSKIVDKIPSQLDCSVGLLIGYNCPKALAPLSVIQHGGADQPYAIETILGWSIVGGLTSPAPEQTDEIGLSHRIMSQEVPSELHIKGSSSAVLAHRTKVQEFNVDAYEVIRLLEGDFCTPIETRPMSQEDQRFVDILSSTIYQDSTGHYVMPLPFKEDKPLLPNNRQQALARFRILQKRLAKNAELKHLYTNFIDELVSAGEAELVPEEEVEASEVWYLPHHGVLNPNKPGKVRVVFDGSCDYKGHVLNKYLLQGPDLNNNLVGVLTRFRKEHVTVSCDVSKMFYQFKVSPACRDYLRFLWIHPEDDQRIVDYRMTVHIFGATSSPGCAKFGLLKLASDHGQSHPKAMNFIKRNFYVDDGLGSCNSTSEAVQLLSDARAICAQGNLKLHKLLSNKPAVLEAFPKSDWAINLGGLPEFSQVVAPTERMLGLQWCLTTDQFSFYPKLKEATISRRMILSNLASIFDPLGFIAPVTLLGRQILQHCCDGLDWDDPLPETIVVKWKKWLSDAGLLSSVKIPRCLKPDQFGHVTSAELHTFADASEQGYGACCYIRLCDQEGHIHCSLLFGKARVPPLKKKITIPRMELQSALLAARIGNQMSNELDLSCKSYFYTDSLIVLGYITNNTKRFHVFVANRVSQIRELTAVSQWRHINGSLNPADHASRGLSTTQLMTSNWFRGPDSLWQDELPQALPDVQIPEDDPEVKCSAIVHAEVTYAEEEPMQLSLQNRWPKWNQALKFTAMILHTARFKWKQTCSTVELVQQAESWILSALQRRFFLEEILLLKNGKRVSKSSPLWRLDPFLDESGILRVGGRLKYSTYSQHIKHPVILPKKHHITTLLVRHYHNLIAHQGRGTTLSAIRSAGYWIINGNSLVSSIIYYCVTCRRLRRPTEYQKMSDLPSERTEPSPPFSYTGCDCFGPFMVKDGRKYVKKYGLIFTCLSSRAVHIELMDDMSTDAFINSLRCFIALRGQVRQIRCDRGTNFVGAARELQRALEEVIDDEVRNYLLQHKCDFVFNTPGASHMGGAWERLIRTIKDVLQGVMLQSQSRLDASSARTVMYEAMALVNSRPIAFSNEAELEPLTPNHLIMMKSNIALPPPGNFQEGDMYARRRWRKVQSLIESFWARWKSQYLSTLTLRQKWQDKRRNIAIGDIVLLKETQHRGDWKLGRVVDTSPSADGLVRKVKLRVGSSSSDQQGLLERPVTKMVVLIEAGSQH